MSGWENVPEEAPKPPRKRSAVAAAAAIAAEPEAAMSDVTAEDGPLARLIDEYWPHAWLTMLTIVCAIAIWAAVGKLPNSPSWWP
jgi:hypothetical protein